MVHRFYMIIIAFAFCSCTVSKKGQDRRDRSMIDYVEKNKGRIHDAAAFAIGFTWEEKLKEFNVNEVPDKRMKRLLSDFAFTIEVHYNMNGDLYDSTVT